MSVAYHHSDSECSVRDPGLMALGFASFFTSRVHPFSKQKVENRGCSKSVPVCFVCVIFVECMYLSICAPFMFEFVVAQEKVSGSVPCVTRTLTKLQLGFVCFYRKNPQYTISD